MISKIIRRPRIKVSLVSRNYYSTKSPIIEQCPKPEYDTGCTYCEIPKFPKDKPIDFEKNLNGTQVLPWKHLLILSHGCENFEEMPSKIEMIPLSLANELNYNRKMVSPYHPIMISNVTIDDNKEINDLQKNEQLVYLYPDKKIIKFNLKDTKKFIKKYLVPSDEEMKKFKPVYNPFTKLKPTLLSKMKPQDININDAEDTITESKINNDLILICGHMKRDLRCGLLAPILKNEFKKVLQMEKIDCKLGLISHIGGHAYAGNVIYFPRDVERETIWYGRVFPELVQGIVKETIIKGNIIKQLYRGEL